MSECIFCGEEWDTQYNTHWMLDVRVNHAEGDCYIQCFPCCMDTAEALKNMGYEDVTGRSLESVVQEITGFDVLEVTESGDGAVVCRLQVYNPTQKSPKQDKHGNHSAKGPSGWRTDVFGDVDEHHRHHDPPTGWKFGVAVYNGHVRVGVAVVGRPTSRALQAAEPHTLEVTRVCTWGHSALRKNVSSKLYAEAAKQSRILGYDKLVTYTIFGVESGASVRCAGWTPTHVSSGGSWDRPGRRRQDKAPTGQKVRWEKGLTKKKSRAVRAREISLP